MAKLYVANTSKQIVDFCYRIRDEKEYRRRGLTAEGEIILEKNYRTEKIGVGQQILVGGGRLSEKDIACVIDQYADKGLVDSTKISRMQDFAGLCYRLDLPVAWERLHVVFESNDDKLNDRAAVQRETSSAAIAKKLAEDAQDFGAELKRSEVEMKEDSREATGKFAEGFETVGDGVKPRHSSERRSVRARSNESKGSKRSRANA
jgi:hypothetical protein